MAKRLVRLLCLVLCVAMVLTSAGCSPKNTSDEKKDLKKPQSSSQKEVTDDKNSDDSIPDDGEELPDDEDLGDEGYIDDGYVDDGFDDGYIDDGFNNVGETGSGFYLPDSYYVTESLLDDELPEDDDWELGDIGNGSTDDDIAFGTSSSPIQMVGQKVNTSERVFNVDVNDVVYDDFLGYGSNTFPSSYMAESKDLYPEIDSVMFEVESDRFTAIKGHLFRVWFQVDWITTTEETNPKRTDIENNKDYQNYKNGIYDFDSPKMQTVYPYFDLWQDNGTELCINYGWKASTVIQEWFNFPGLPNPQVSAPYDLEAYGKSCATLLDELINKRGYTNIKHLAFYNEPNIGDWETLLDEREYWILMLQYVGKWLEKKGIRDKINIWSAGENSMNANHYEFTEYCKFNGAEYFDQYDGHYYYGRIADMRDNNYEYAYKLFCFFREYFNEHTFYITENYTGVYGKGMDEWTSGNWTGYWQWWNDTTTSFIIAGANSGMRALLKWGFTGGCLPDPQFFDPASGYESTWMLTNSVSRLENGGVHAAFFDESLFTNYIPAHSDVLMLDWTGDDVRGAAFRSPKGEYTVVVEANGTCSETDGTDFEVKDAKQRQLKINLNGNSKNLKFYRYYFNPDHYLNADINQHATILQHDKTINAKETISDTIGKELATYVYTTVPPVKQVEINDNDGKGENFYKIAAGETINLSAAKIDCAASDELVWKITEHTFSTDSVLSGLTQNGNTASFTMPVNVNKGERLAMRCSLKNDPLTFDVVVIQVK